MAWPSDKAWLMVSVFCQDLSLPLDCTWSYILVQNSFTAYRTFISNPRERWRCLTGQKSAEWNCWCNVWRVTRVLEWCLNTTYSNLTTCFLRHFFFERGAEMPEQAVACFHASMYDQAPSTWHGCMKGHVVKWWVPRKAKIHWKLRNFY